MSTIDVALAYLFDRQGAVLLTQRPAHKHYGGLWEFPGGKLDAGETVAQAIVRELREELCIEVTVVRALAAYTFAVDATTTLRFHPVLCDWTPTPLTLMEHSASAFVPLDALLDYALAPPDVAAVERLRDAVAANGAQRH